MLAHGTSIEGMKAFRIDMHRRMKEYGRDPSTLKILFLIDPILGDTDRVAQAREEDMKAARFGDDAIEKALWGLSYTSGGEFDFSTFDLDEEVPDDLDVHLILDDYSTHKTPDIHRWLLKHPRFHLHFTPTSGSWLNMVERWFGELTTKKIKRGAHTNVPNLEKDIREWIELWNQNPRPYVWVKTADQILASIARYCERISAAAAPQ